MKTQARVIKVLDLISGESDNGNYWEKQTVVFETIGLEPQTLAVEFMGERRTKHTKGLEPGDVVNVSFVIRCNEYMGKWYTRLDGLGVQCMNERDENPPQQEGGQFGAEHEQAPPEAQMPTPDGELGS